MDREIVLLGDVHDDAARLGGTLELLRGAMPELVLLAGDLGLDPPRDSPERGRAAHDDSLRRVLAAVRRSLGGALAFVPGNHDLRDAVRDVAALNCDGRLVAAADLSILGLGGAGPDRFGFPYEWSEREADAALRRAWAGGAPRVDILLSHTPPRKSTLDRTHRGRHVGSRVVRRWIERVRPALFVCGHIHEAWGLETIAGVPCLNAGALGEPFGQEIAWRVTWRDGAPTRIRSLRRVGAGEVETRDWV